jgi:hypothetical protein
MRIVITGATGFIGRALSKNLAEDHDVIALTRNMPKAKHILGDKIKTAIWNIERLDGWEKILNGCNVIINLAGANLAAGRWNKKFKENILLSRINSNAILLEGLKKIKYKPEAFVLSSGFLSHLIPG